jgi:cell division protein FtsL
MAKNRKNQAAAIRFGPVIKVLLLCALFCGSAVGYVWQKNQIYQLGKQISEANSHLKQLTVDNKKLSDQLAYLRSVVTLDQRARSLGLAPAQPMQVVRLPEPTFSSPEDDSSMRLLAARRADATTQ